MRASGEEGHSLVELLAATTVLSIGLVAAMSMLLGSSTLVRNAARRGGAGVAATRALDLYRAGGLVADTATLTLPEGRYLYDVRLSPGDSGLAGGLAVAARGADTARIFTFDPARAVP